MSTQSRTAIEIKLKYLQVMIKKCLSDVSIGSLDQLTKQLNPHVNPTIGDVILNFLKGMLAFSMVQKTLGRTYDHVFATILQKAKLIE